MNNINTKLKDILIGIQLTLFFVFLCVSNTFGQFVYWTDFDNSTVLQGALIGANKERSGTAASQNELKENYEWILDYTITINESAKVLGIANPREPISFARMDLGIHISSSRENLISIFVLGKLITKAEIRTGDSLKVYYEGGSIFIRLNGRIILSEVFNIRQPSRFVSILDGDASFERMRYNTNYKDVFVSDFDKLNNKGSIRVNIPDDAPAGPYHYLIKTDNYVDLNLINQEMISDSIWMQLSSDLLADIDLDGGYIFEGLDPGEYYVTVLDNELNIVEQEKIVVMANIEVLSTSNLIKEGDLLVAGTNESFADLNAFISNENGTGSFGVQVYDIVNQQFFGFGYDSEVMTGATDITYGFYIMDEKAFPILDGVINYDLGTTIYNNAQLFIKCDDYKFDLFMGEQIIVSIDIAPTIRESMAELNIKLNLKLGLLKEGIQLLPLDYRYDSRFYSIKPNITHLNCGDEFGSITVGVRYTSFFSLNNYSIVLKDENNIQMVPSPPTPYQLIGFTVYNSLVPGTYTLTGFIYMTDYLGNPISQSVNISLELGYKTDWLNIDNNYIETPNNHSVKVQGHNESFYIQARSRNHLKYDEEGWIEYTPIYGNEYWGQPFRFLTSNLSTNPSQSPYEVVYEDNIRHYKSSTHGLFIIPHSEQQGMQSGITVPFGARIKLKFTTDVALPNYPNGKVLVYVNNILRSSFPRLNSSIAVVPNSIKNGYGYKDCITSFGCPDSGSDNIYAHLKYEMDGFYHIMEYGKIKFLFDQEYDSQDLKFNLYSSKDILIKTEADFPLLMTEYGENLLTIDVSLTSNCIGKGFFYIEVINSKKEKLYLRFYNDTWVEGCDEIIADPNYNDQ